MSIDDWRVKHDRNTESRSPISMKLDFETGLGVSTWQRGGRCQPSVVVRICN